MQTYQTIILALWLIFNVYATYVGVKHSSKGKAFGLTPHLYFTGSFVWADAIVFGPFWILATLASWFFQDWLLFLLLLSVFWLIRSVGETIYWFNEQFTSKHLNEPHTLPMFGLVKNEAIWFIYQIIMQCITVVSTITTIYLAAKWLQTI